MVGLIIDGGEWTEREHRRQYEWKTDILHVSETEEALFDLF